ncbi:MAG: hypothetical protein PHO02_05365 [Candidatus Nanoarchaeia archaeon]|nr:hypothetical protein [Candidatus Nanoarchaeia archaeon]
MAKKDVKSIKIDLTKKPITRNYYKHGIGGGYGLGMIGAAVYFISTSVGFWAGVLGFLKAIVWPAFVVYGLLKFLGM